MTAPDAAFYFDLGSPLAYLAAERVLHVLPGPAEWQPVLARALPRAESFEACRCRTEQDVVRSEIERSARTEGLQPLKWPSPFPFDSALAMRVATYAKSIGRAVPFAQAAFRQAFAGGRSLAEPDNVLIAAAACEMHPTAVLRGAELRAVREQLLQTTMRAARLGVDDVPAVAVGERVFGGERCLQDAATYMRERTRGTGSSGVAPTSPTPASPDTGVAPTSPTDTSAALPSTAHASPTATSPTDTSSAPAP
ncbi:MAG TPA: DsbA family protein [Solirubrobacteraceae bacterium]|nr:DsbA family protein [Solirubrobacteraceae bacterium]